MSTRSENFLKDKRLAKARSLINEALDDHTSKLKLRGPDPALKLEYDQLMQRCSQARGANIYYPYIGSGLGRGPLVELEDGSVKYDFITGIGVHYFGHCHPQIVAAQLEAAVGNTVMQGHLQQNRDQVELMEQFIGLAEGSNLKHCFLTSSGATANENALKIIFQKKYPADRILCFKHCFAGRTMALAQMTDKALYRDGLPRALEVDYLPFYDPADHQGSLRKTLGVLRRHIERFPGRHAAMCLELIQGEGGYNPGNKKFFKELIKELKRASIAVWVDEVQSFGRSSRPFAYQHFGLDKKVDVVTVGKMSQVCATLFRSDFRPRPGLISQTFTSSTAAIKASQVTLEMMRDGGLFGPSGKIAELNRTFTDGLEKISCDTGMLAGPWGLGAMVAMTVYDGSLEKSKDFCRRLFENGVIAFIAGRSPVRVRFLMPVAATEKKDIKEVLKIIRATLEG